MAAGQGPVERFADLLESLDEHVTAANRRARSDNQNRITLLFGHGVFAVLVTPGMALLTVSGMSSPSYVILRRIPGAPLTLAVWIGVAGAALAVATYRRHRLAEYVALAAMAAWYLVTFTSFIGACVLWLTAPGPADWLHAPSFAAPVIYAHLCFTLSAHMRTLRKRGLRGGRR